MGKRPAIPLPSGFCAWLVFLMLAPFTAAHSQDVSEIKDGREIKELDPALRATMTGPLRGCRPHAKPGVQRHIDKKGNDTLYGDLFGTGQNFAMTECSRGVGFSVWRKDHWEPLQAWAVDINWEDAAHLQPPEVYEGRSKPVKQAFWTLPVSKGRRVAVVAGEMEKSWQEFYLFQFNAKTQRIESAGWSRRTKPKYRDGFVIQYDDSGRRAIWQASSFYRVDDGMLTHVADWKEVSPYHDTDKSYRTVTLYDAGGKVSEALKIYDPEGDDDYDDVIVHFDKDEDEAISRADALAASKAYAAIKYVWPKKDPPDTDQNDLQEAYLFEKLTGLPRKLYPETSDRPLSRTLESAAKIEVKGSPEAVARLSPATR